jgi:hypothetical protein
MLIQGLNGPIIGFYGILKIKIACDAIRYRPGWILHLLKYLTKTIYTYWVFTWVFIWVFILARIIPP